MMVMGKEIENFGWKLFDKGISIFLLVIAVWFLVKRDDAMSEKMDTYQNTDRVQLVNTINNNTEVLHGILKYFEESTESPNNKQYYYKQSKHK